MARQYRGFDPRDRDQVRERLTASTDGALRPRVEAHAPPHTFAAMRAKAEFAALELPESRSAGYCRFCDSMDTQLYTMRMRLRDPGPGAPERKREEAAHRWKITAPLCDHHYGVLLRAEERGRVHQGSRVRYWLEDDPTA